ncbi:MAG: glycosyltransferase [Bryobacteraceae bacterium]
MKILWMKSDYLHPTTRGGQIRTLEMLRCLHKRHEIHYVCLEDSRGANRQNEEGPARCHEYCTAAYPVRHSVPQRRSLRFGAQLATGLVSELPVPVSRYRSTAMLRQVQTLLESGEFDSLVCDFLFPAPNVPDLSEAVLFQHNVESVIWKRHAAEARNPAIRAYFSLQARRMERYERAVCRSVCHVIAVSEADRQTFQNHYGVSNVSSVQTGVDLDFFKPPPTAEPQADLVFCGSMDWLPNIDGARFFIEQIYPHIRAKLPSCRVAFVGRHPSPWLKRLTRDPNLIVTGTVPDVRPWFWGARVSIVPLRIGGGTRLKIFEAMAAQVPVVSTAIGAEGLPVVNGRHLLIEDDPRSFADACIALLKDSPHCRELASEAWMLVAGRFSWEAVTKDFESILESHSLRSSSVNMVTAV